MEGRLLLSDSPVPGELSAPMTISAPLTLSAGVSSPIGLTPAQVRHFYGLDQVSFDGITGDGGGQTIAIVDQGINPDVVSSTSPSFSTSDLHVFDQTFGLPDPPSFTALPYNNPGSGGSWDGEIAMDVEWAHAIAPGANIVLVENGDPDIFNAVAYAASLPGVSVVSMSWTIGGVSNPNATYDAYMTTPTGHQGVSFFAATGDSGGGCGYPADSVNCVGVGGTNPTLDANNNYVTETGWSGSAGGIDSNVAKSSWQSSITQSSLYRCSPDVSMDSTNAAVYDPASDGTSTPWTIGGGTSLSTPMWAAVVAIANQYAASLGLNSLDGPSQTLPALYSSSYSDFHDVALGANNNYSCTAGYDLVTGLGTPVSNLLIPDMVRTADFPLSIVSNTPVNGAQLISGTSP
jgi:subtilase family serine protease